MNEISFFDLFKENPDIIESKKEKSTNKTESLKTNSEKISENITSKVEKNEVEDSSKLDNLFNYEVADECVFDDVTESVDEINTTSYDSDSKEVNRTDEKLESKFESEDESDNEEDEEQIDLLGNTIGKSKKKNDSKGSKKTSSKSSSAPLSGDKKIENDCKKYNKIIVKYSGITAIEIEDKNEINKISLNNIKERLITENGFGELNDDLVWRLTPAREDGVGYLQPSNKLLPKG